MNTPHYHTGQHRTGLRIPPPGAKSALRSSEPVGSLGALQSHALAMEHEAVTRYREFATHMADCGWEELAALFRGLADAKAEQTSERASHGGTIAMPSFGGAEHAWLGRSAIIPEAQAFVFRMMTPHLALEIALGAERRAKEFFERVRDESTNARVRGAAAELARKQQSYIDRAHGALERTPRSARSDELVGDPTIEQQN